MIDILRIKEDFKDSALPRGMYFSRYVVYIQNNYAYSIDDIRIEYNSDGFKKYNISHMNIYDVNNSMWKRKINTGGMHIVNNLCFDFVENLILDYPFQIRVFHNDETFYNRIRFDNCAFKCRILNDPEMHYVSSNCEWNKL